MNPTHHRTTARPQPVSRDGFRIAIICALPLEAGMVERIFDHEWDQPYGKAHGDSNVYTFGRLATHNIVLTYMPRMGSNSAASTASGLRSSFPRIEFAFVVGICGVVPYHPETGDDIFLGDCIISTSLVQYDYGRRYPKGFARKTEDNLDFIGQGARSLLAKLNNERNRQRLVNRLRHHLEHLQQNSENGSPPSYPGVERDRLFESSYLHEHLLPDGETCEKCLNEHGTCTKDCDDLPCDITRLVPRQRSDLSSGIHFGRFGSANTVLRSGEDRDQLAKTEHLVAFEMEGSGVWASLPSVLVIKSACDYADSHKNKEWQSYAAATAACGLKAVLEKLDLADEGSTALPFHMSVQSARNTAPEADSKINKPAIWSLPFSRDEDFTGRKDILKQLWQAFEERNPSYQWKVALLGMGGVGKSQIAIEWAYQVREKFQHYSTFWIHANTASRFEQGYRDIASSAGLSITEDTDLLRVVYRYLSQDHHDWIMILDNVDDNETFNTRNKDGKTLRDYVSQNTRGTILVTSRNHVAAANLVGSNSIIQVSPMAMDDSLDLLKTRLQIKSNDEADAKTLIGSLEHLPLAIAHAGSYITTRSMSLSRYLALFTSERNQTKLLNDGTLRDPRRDGAVSNTVMATWQISFQAIEAQSTNAADLLKLLCMFDNQSIPKILFRKWFDMMAKDIKGRGFEENSRLESDEENYSEIELALEESISILASFSVVKIESTGSLCVKIHRLVQLAMILRLQEFKDLERWQGNALFILNELFPGNEYKDRERGFTLLPHAERVIKYHPDSLLTSYDYGLADNLASFSHAVGRYGEALRYARKRLRAAEAVWGLPSPAVFMALLRLGRELQDNGKFKEAEQVIDRLDNEYRIPRMKKRLDYDTNTAFNPDLDWQCCFPIDKEFTEAKYPRLVAELAEVLTAQNRYKEAEPLFRCALQLFPAQVSGEQYLHKLEIMNSLAILLGQTDRNTEAMELHSEVHEGRTRILGGRHPSALSSISGLASSLSKMQRYTEAIVLLREVYDARKDILGVEHPHTIDALGDLASQTGLMGRYEESILLHREALSLAQRILGMDHIATLLTMENLSFTLSQTERYTEAEQLARASLQTMKKVLLERDLRIQSVRRTLRQSLETQRKFNEAEAICREELEYDLKYATGEAFRTMFRLGYNLLKQGDYAQAENCMLRSLVHHPDQECLVTSDWDHRLTKGWLCEALEAQGKYEEAESLWREVLKDYADADQTASVAYESAVAWLAHNLQTQGKFADAESVWKTSLNLAVTLYGPESNKLLTARSWLSRTLEAQGKYKEAEPLHRENLAHERRLKDTTNGKRAQVGVEMHNLGYNLVKQERFSEAEALFRQALEEYPTDTSENTSMDVQFTVWLLCETLCEQDKFDELDAVVEEWHRHDPEQMNEKDCYLCERGFAPPPTGGTLGLEDPQT